MFPVTADRAAGDRGTAALLAVAAVLALAVGAVLRRSAAAVTTVIVAIVLPYILASPRPAGRRPDWLLRLTPAAAFAIQQTVPQYPQVSASTRPYRLLPAGALGRFRRAVRLGRRRAGLAVFLLRRRDA